MLKKVVKLLKKVKLEHIAKVSTIVGLFWAGYITGGDHILEELCDLAEEQGDFRYTIMRNKSSNPVVLGVSNLNR